MSKKGKFLIAASLLLLFIAFILLNLICISLEISATAEFFERFWENLTGPHLHNIFILFGTLVLLAFLLLFGVPLLIYLFELICKMFLYLSLWLVCIKKHHKFKLQRPMFAFLFGVKEVADVQIHTSDGIFWVHFLNVPFGLGKCVTFINEYEYCITSTRANQVKRVGTRLGQSVAFNTGEETVKNGKIHKIPTVASENIGYHIFVTIPGIVKVKKVSENEIVDASAETRVGNVIICSIKTLKKRLKGNLYVPLNK